MTSCKRNMGNYLGGWQKRVLQIWIVVILATGGFVLSVVFRLQNVYARAWWTMVVLGFIAFNLYWYYLRYHRKKKPRYPMVPPEGKHDVYFPRSDIPRPIHDDARRMREKKLKLAKKKKMSQKKK